MTSKPWLRLYYFPLTSAVKSQKPDHTIQSTKQTVGITRADILQIADKTLPMHIRV